MTKGKPMSLILRFLIPVAIGNLFQQLYNTVDSIIVGRFVGMKAFAAVGSTGTITFFILGFLMGLTQGFTVLVSQRYGAGDYKGVKKATVSAIILAFIVASFMTAMSLYFMKDLLHIMNTPEDIMTEAYEYVTVICGGILCTVLYNMMAALLRAVGDSRSPLYFLIISVVLNCILDLTFIIYFKMGVAGAAYATVVSQGVSGVLCIFYIWKKIPILHPEKEDIKLDAALAKDQLRIGIPMALQFSITAIGTIILQSALNLLGSVAVAAYAAAIKIEILITQAFPAIGATMATYSAQNIGIGDIERIKKGVRSANILSAGYSVVIGILMATVLSNAISLFITGDAIEEVKAFAIIYMRVAALCYVFLGFIFIYRNTLQGVGFALLPMMAGVVELVCRTVLALIAAKQRSFTGVCLANMSAWIGAALFLMLIYEIKIKRKRN